MSGAKDTIYLDHAAATPVRPEVLEAVATASRELPGNPSALGRPGRVARRRLRQAREELASLLGCPPEGLIFTSGGTESVGLAVLGSIGDRAPAHVVTSSIEHPCVLNSLALLEKRGHAVTRVAVGPSGVVDPERFGAAATAETALACLMHVSNELGTIQPVAEAFAAVRRRAPRALTLTDAVQSFTRLALAPADWPADLLAVSAHKIGGPRGVGALACLGRRPAPLWGGGDQEQGSRPGTENLPGIVGFAVAARLALAERDERLRHARQLRDRLQAALRAHVPEHRINGDPARAIPFIVSVSVHGLPSEVLLRGLEELGVIASAGAACHARSQRQSHVLRAIGVPSDLGTLRLSLAGSNTPEEMDAAALALAQTLERYALS